MKKIFSAFACIVLIFTLCSCKDNLSQGLDSSNTTTGNHSSTTTDNSSSTTTNTSSSKPESSTPQSSESSSVPTSSEEKTNESVPSKVTSTSSPSTESQKPQNIPVITPSKFTVTDPDNLKGLSTVKNYFSYGISSNGKPHNQSIKNQNTFDSFANVEALALDNKSTEKVMYLTFDNGYEYENLTADILDTLKEKNVKAAFFITMSYAKYNKDLVRRMIDEGHIVGNHSTTHPSFPDLNRTQMAVEIEKLDNYLIENFSYTSPYFRFPSGEYSECALELVTSIGFKSVFWSTAYADWDTSAQKGEEYAYNTVTSRFHPGAVILLHAVSRDNAQSLGRIIDTAISEGYTFKTLDDYFKQP